MQACREQGGPQSAGLRVWVARWRHPASVWILADTAVLLFLAMPMLAVGGILVLITNLQV